MGKGEFEQSGIGKKESGTEAALDHLQEKLTDGIQKIKHDDVKSIVAKTMDEKLDKDEIDDYMSDIHDIRKDLITSQDSSSWLQTVTDEFEVNSVCEI